MENKAINLISNNLDIIRKMLEKNQNEKKQASESVMSGDELKAILEKISVSVDETKNVFFDIRKSISKIGSITKKNMELLNKSNDEKLLKILNEISSITKKNMELLNKSNDEKLLKILNEISIGVNGILKKDGSVKLTNENKKDIERMMREVKKDKSSEKIYEMMSLISNLKSISLKDLLLGKKKIKKVKEVYKDLSTAAAKLGDEKEVKKIKEFTETSIGLMKQLTKVVGLSKLASIGVKGLDKVLFGTGRNPGIVTIFEKIRDKGDLFEKTNKTLGVIMNGYKDIVKMSLLMTTMVVLGGPAMVGAWITYGVVSVMVKIHEKLKNNREDVRTGSVSMSKLIASMSLLGLSLVGMYKLLKDVSWETFAKMSATVGVLIGVVILAGTLQKTVTSGTKSLEEMGKGFVFVGASIFVMYLSIKNVNWKNVGVMAASLVVLTGVVALMGVSSVLLKRGNRVMKEMGVGFIFIGASLMVLYNSVKGMDWKTLGILATTIGALAAVTAVCGVFAGVIGLGSLALASMGISLVALGGGMFLFDKLVSDSTLEKVGTGVPKVIDALSSTFGSGKENPTFGDSVMGFVTGLMKVGGVMFTAAALVVTGVGLSLFALSLKVWERVNTKSVDNIEYTISKLDSVLGLNSKDDQTGGRKMQLKDNIFSLAMSALSFGRMFFKMGTLLVSSIVLTMTKFAIDRWKKFDKNSIDNFAYAYNSLDEIFGLRSNNDNKSVNLPLTGALGEGLGLISSMLTFGSTFFKMGTLLLTCYTMGLVRKSIDNFKDFDVSSVEKLTTTFDAITETFGLKPTSQSVGLGDLVNVGGDILKLASSLLSFGSTFFTMGSILLSVWTMNKVLNIIDDFEKYNVDSGLDKLSSVVSRVKKIFGLGGLIEEKENDSILASLGKKLVNLGGKTLDFASGLLSAGGNMAQMGSLLMGVGILDTLAQAISNMESVDDVEGDLKKMEMGIKKIKEIFGTKDSSYAKMEDNTKSFNKSIDKLMDIMKNVSNNKKYVDDFNDLSGIIIESLVIWNNDGIKRLFGEDKGVFKNYLSNVKTFDKMFGKFIDIMKNVSEHDREIIKFNELSDNIIESLSKWNDTEYVSGAKTMLNVIDGCVSPFSKLDRHYTKNVDKTIELINALGNIDSKWSRNNPLANAIDKVNNVDMDKVNSLTTMFKSFASLGEKSVFNTFKKSVDEFTKACVELVDAINGNTDALNSDDTPTTTQTNSGTQQTSGTNVNITNTEELARLIADNINNVSSRGGRGSSVQTVELRINGQDGNRWVISRY